MCMGDESVVVQHGTGKLVHALTLYDATRDTPPALPPGDYEAEVGFYPNWGFKDEESRRTGITKQIHATAPIRVHGSGESASTVALRRRHQQWIGENWVPGQRWDPASWHRRFGKSVEVPVSNAHLGILSRGEKAYYFPSIDMTIFVQTRTHEIDFWRLGKASE
jgi:hypothetical protein